MNEEIQMVTNGDLLGNKMLAVLLGWENRKKERSERERDRESDSAMI